MVSRTVRLWPQGLLLGLAALPTLVQAGAWTPNEGSAYHKFALNTFSSESSFGPAVPGFRKFTDNNFTYYVEYGITDTLTFYGSLPIKRLTSETVDGTARSSGVGDIDLGLRRRLYFDGTSVVSASVLFKAPYAYDKNAAVPRGNGQVDLEARVLYGRSLGRYGYFGLEAGYRYRAGAPADEFRYLLEYGFDASDKVYLRTKLDGIAGLRNSSGTSNTSRNPTLNLDFDLGKLETTAGFKFSKTLAGEFTVTQNLYGSNTLRGTNYSLALVYAY